MEKNMTLTTDAGGGGSQAAAYRASIESGNGGEKPIISRNPGVKTTGSWDRPVADLNAQTNRNNVKPGMETARQPVTVVQNGQKEIGYVEAQPQAAEQAAQVKQPQQETVPNRYDTLSTYYNELYGGETPSRAQELGAYYDELYNREADGYYNEAREYARGLYDESLGDIERQRGELNEQYAGTNRQLYRDYMNSLKNLPQQLAAGGYTGGLSESSRVRLNSGYGENLGASERARLQAVAQMEGQEAQARRQYNQYLMELRGQERDETRAAEDQRSAYLLGLQEQDYNAAQSAQTQKNAYLMALREQEYADQLSQAETLAQYTGDFSGYKAMGYSDAEIEALRQSWIAQNPGLAKAMGYTKKARSGYSSVPAASTPAEEIAIMRAAGMTDSQIGAAYQTVINNDPELTAAEKAVLRNAYKDEMVRDAATGLSAAEQRAEQLRGR